MITRNIFMRLTNNKKKPWRKEELQKICKSLNLKTNLTNKEMYSNIKSFYNIRNKVLLHDWKYYELQNILKKKNISIKGTKKDLFYRVLQLKKNNLNGGSYFKKYTISIHQEQGKREYMEDRFIAKCNQKICFFSILDGHGGKSCANFLKKNLYDIFIKIYEKNKHINIKKILKQTYLYADNMFLKTNKKSGSTACSLFINNKTKMLAIANTGDSRIIGLIDNKIIQLSVDHKPEDIDEKRRIYANGGFVANSRLNGILAMSRSMGDILLKQKGLTSYPDIIIGKVTKKFKYLVIASDGLYDVMTNYEIIQFIQYNLSQGIKKQNIAKRLVLYSIEKRYSTDNVSVIIIFLN